MKTLVLLDFDGTVYRGDSMLDFARLLNPKKYRRSMVLIFCLLPFYWVLPGYRDLLKIRFLQMNFAGIERRTLEEKGGLFHELNRENCFPKALSWLKEVDREMHEIVLVSASCREWLQPFAAEWKIKLICTELEYRNERCTGRWIGQNLRGMEKVKAVREKLDLSNYATVVAYGNERSDLAFREIAQRVEINYFQG